MTSAWAAESKLPSIDPEVGVGRKIDSAFFGSMRYPILTGMMGAGKTSVGRRVAEILNLRFADTDQLLERRLGRSIASFFQAYGEEAFREHESMLLKQLESEPRVLSTGGGIVLRQENRRELARLGRVIYLRARVDTLTDRLQHSHERRPLLKHPDWRERLARILDERESLYLEAETVIEVDGVEPAQTAKQIVEVVRED